jgi:hypothetical protein
MNNFFQKFSDHAWNIGFIKKNIASFVEDKGSYDRIFWLKHGYKDRYFADPFILNVNEDGIEILAEEFIYLRAKGTIVRLDVDFDFNLVRKVKLLELDTHLSYPYILRHYGNTYVIPENNESHKLFMYRYSKEKGLMKDRVLLNKGAIDPSIFKYKDIYYTFCTFKDTGQYSNAHIFFTDDLENVNPHRLNPISGDENTGRCAGRIIEVDDRIIRPTQNCKLTYGGSIIFKEIVRLSEGDYQEKDLFEMLPKKDTGYNIGLHHFDYMNDLIVVDGRGKNRFIPMTKVINKIRRLLKRIFRF